MFLRRQEPRLDLSPSALAESEARLDLLTWDVSKNARGSTRVDLISAEIRGFRRFRKSQTLKTKGKLAALIGPNEAGKSSILAALMELNSNEPFPSSAKSWDAEESELRIIAVYELSDAERQKLGHSIKLGRELINRIHKLA